MARQSGTHVQSQHLGGGGAGNQKFKGSLDCKAISKVA